MERDRNKLYELHESYQKQAAKFHFLQKKYNILLRIQRLRLLSLWIRIPGARFVGKFYGKLLARIKIKQYKSLILQSGLFDTEFYLQHNRDIKNSATDPLNHFILHGGEERRHPNATFDMRCYSSLFPELLVNSSINPLVHYINHGFRKDVTVSDNCGDDIESLLKGIVFSKSKRPVVSIILPLENNLKYLYETINSIVSSSTRVECEILIVASQSIELPSSLCNHSGLQVILAPHSNTYTKLCNFAIPFASGEFVVFLKDTIKVFSGWLDELVDTLSVSPNIGAVVSKILYPNGRIKEVGVKLRGTVCYTRNGALHYFDEPNLSFLQEVDSCAMFSLLISKADFIAYGMFDEKYDTEEAVAADLSFKIRDKGDVVVCQPLSLVEHYVPVSCGDIHFLEKDAVKLDACWATMLTRVERKKNTPKNFTRNSDKLGKLLSIDRMPKPDNDAGSVVTYQFLKIFSQLGFQVTFIPDDLAWADRYTEDLQRFGVQCLYAPYISSFHEHLERFGKDYDVVHLHRVHIAGKYIDLIRKYCPNAKIVFLVADLHWLREERQAQLIQSAQLLEAASRTKQIELSVVQKSDVVVVHSDIEYDILLEELTEINIKLIPLIFEIPGCMRSFAERDGILFIGGYKHQPNLDAVLSFVNEMWPELKKRIPDLVFYVIGADVPDEILQLHGDGIEVVGYVANLDEYFNRCRVSVVPLRFGAGMKGKIGTSLSYGVPVVSTPIGVEGMSLQKNKEIIVAESGSDFVDGVERLYTDEILWQSVSRAGLSFLQEQYSFDAGKKRVVDLLKSIDRDHFMSGQVA